MNFKVTVNSFFAQTLSKVERDFAYRRRVYIVLGIVSFYFALLGRMTSVVCDLSKGAFIFDCIALLISLAAVWLSGLTCFCGFVCFFTSAFVSFLYGSVCCEYYRILSSNAWMYFAYSALVGLLAVILMLSFAHALTFSAVCAKGVGEMLAYNRLLYYFLRFCLLFICAAVICRGIYSIIFCLG